MYELGMFIVDQEELGNKKCYIIFCFQYSFDFVVMVALQVELCHSQT